MKLDNIQFHLVIEKKEIQVMINTMEYYLTCEPCLNSYKSIQDLFIGESHTLELLYKLCELIQRNDFYVDILSRISKFYNEEE